MIRIGNKLDFTKKEDLAWNTEIYQLDDGTIFYRNYTPSPQRLYVKWMGQELKAEIPRGYDLDQLSSIQVHGSELYIVMQGKTTSPLETRRNESEKKIFRVTFTPPERPVMKFVRDIRGNERVLSNVLSCHKAFYRVCEESKDGLFGLDISEEESLELRGIHRGHLLYVKMSHHTKRASVTKPNRENVLVIELPHDSYSRLVARDTSSFAYITNGKSIITIDLEKQKTLPTLKFRDGPFTTLLYDVLDDTLTVRGPIKNNEYSLMTAKLPNGFFPPISPEKVASRAEMERMMAGTSAKQMSAEMEVLIRERDEKQKEMTTIINQKRERIADLEMTQKLNNELSAVSQQWEKRVLSLEKDWQYEEMNKTINQQRERISELEDENDRIQRLNEEMEISTLEVFEENKELRRQYNKLVDLLSEGENNTEIRKS